ncbi:MAG: dihydroxyacetone kinase subunit DhaL [Candidatus Atribacteria bacterium]|nr:dihydroxyacetone kinase subunit DhaL [Candidatus Atribacteria bacterium]
MNETISYEKVCSGFAAILDHLQKNRQALNDLDSPIGDSDHGESVTGAFQKVQVAVDAFPKDQRDIGALLQAVGKSIILSGGAAMGPLYGTAFLDAGKAVLGKGDLAPEDLVHLWEGFAAGIQRRGQVKLNEKTMYDTIYPTAEALKHSFSEGKPLPEMIQDAIQAAKKGMESTKDMLSLRGRSSRLGERSIGHIDPGSASSYLIIEAFFSHLLP